MRNGLLNVLMIPFWCVLLFIMSMAFAWVPMLGWNLGVVSVFPQLPKVGFWQAFWCCIFFGWVIHRPTVQGGN